MSVKSYLDYLERDKLWLISRSSVPRSNRQVATDPKSWWKSGKSAPIDLTDRLQDVRESSAAYL